MRGSGGWITPVDTALLEWFDETGVAAPPKVIWINARESAGCTYTQVKRRLRTLSEAEFVVRHPEQDSYYQLGELGRQWLEGELSPGEVRDLDPR